MKGFGAALARVGSVAVQRIISWSAIVAGLKADPLQRRLLKLLGATVLGPVYVGSGVRIFGASRLSLGARVSLGETSHIVCHAPVTIGDDFLSAPGLHINNGTHDATTLRSRAEPIKIGNRVWCGVRVTICAGVEIGDDVVIGAGAVVVRSIPARSVAVGVPARVVRQLTRDPAALEGAFTRGRARSL
jgi:acetyltransferase-like isoleucine patch superfamily enzyme